MMRGEIPDRDDVFVEEEASKFETFKDRTVVGPKCPKTEMHDG